jgi:hypothetical protein
VLIGSVIKPKYKDPANWWKRIKLIKHLQSPDSNLFDHMKCNGDMLILCCYLK